MTRKHYEAMAEALGKAAAGAALIGRNEDAGVRVMNEALREVEAFLIEDNPAFDPERFRAAVSAAMKARALELVEVELS